MTFDELQEGLALCTDIDQMANFYRFYLNCPPEHTKVVTTLYRQIGIVEPLEEGGSPGVNLEIKRYEDLACSECKKAKNGW